MNNTVSSVKRTYSERKEGVSIERSIWTKVDGKPALVFNNGIPALVFVSHNADGGYDETYENGVYAYNLNRIDIASGVDRITEYTALKYPVK
ncbi:hypothetical protein J2W97_000855 [Paenibacillus jamilae]|uniref:hypothetical protein n=1 Tax=Paenibacillus polymyxa TaxID=1406 RepID=UPI0015812CC7|nr:hypothetical protein [Paenibacillus polymyxa]MDP9674872.1 hypothetical protein [Paenibacillus jamilae]MBY0023765.1 hypothetical protein [Paenibacillus polymyxa]MBY0056437.1 hypothetical protein [Paenibacillus polymyxa]MBY0071784.1 hypothetical protein [Paenibacillus polymyxa]MBY0080650.1 hypothetical protein [Paenibacillus polymyxa]